MWARPAAPISSRPASTSSCRVRLRKWETLAHKAHEICPYSKATKGNIDVAVNVMPGGDVLAQGGGHRMRDQPVSGAPPPQGPGVPHALGQVHRDRAGQPTGHRLRARLHRSVGPAAGGPAEVPIRRPDGRQARDQSRTVNRALARRAAAHERRRSPGADPASYEVHAGRAACSGCPGARRMSGLSVIETLAELDKIDRSMAAFERTAPAAMKAFGGRDVMLRRSQPTCVGPIPRLTNEWAPLAAEHAELQRDARASRDPWVGSPGVCRTGARRGRAQITSRRADVLEVVMGQFELPARQ